MRAHEQWNIDVADLNLVGAFYYLCSILDGGSRAITHWNGVAHGWALRC